MKKLLGILVLGLLFISIDLSNPTAVKAAKAMGLSVAGVDLLRSSTGPKIMEVNSSPGLRGIEEVTGINVARLIIEYIEKNAKLGKVKTKGLG